MISITKVRVNCLRSSSFFSPLVFKKKLFCTINNSAHVPVIPKQDIIKSFPENISLRSALAKLAGSKEISSLEFDNIPRDRKVQIWGKIQETYGLERKELSALKYAVITQGKHIKWSDEFVELVIQEPITNISNEVIEVVNMEHSGHLCFNDKTSKKMFVRQECINLWNFLETRKERFLSVDGAPGVGKSLVVFAYAMWKATKMNQRVLFIHADMVTGISCMFKEDSNSISFRFSNDKFNENPQHLLDFILLQLESEGVDILVLDGDMAWLIEQVFVKLIRYPNVTCIATSYFQSIPRLSSEASSHCVKYRMYLMKSWTIEDLQAAMDGGALVIQTSTLDEIYYYGGGCIRLIQQSVERVQNTITSTLRFCSDIRRVVGIGGVLDRSNDAINSLMAFYDEKSVVVSKFALMRMIPAILSDNFINNVKIASYSNPVWEDLIFELEVLFQAMKQDVMTFRTTTTDEGMPFDQWNILPGGYTYQQFDNVNNDKLRDVKSRWLFSTNWNHGAFDAIFRVSEHHIRFVQITTKSEYSIDISVLIPFISAMDAHVVEVVYVCRSDNFDSFKLPECDKEMLSKVLQDLYDLKVVSNVSMNNIPKSQFTIRKVCFQQ